ncbi:hypothetical protein EJ03DRAFT_267982, partial [Teratosphaeria nubilosa]
ANFQASDRNFLQYRGFLHLHSTLLSALQSDVECLERELDSLEQWDLDSGDRLRMLCLQDEERDDRQSCLEKMPNGFRQRFDRTRPAVLAELQRKLVEYDELLFKARDVNALQRPAKRDYQSVLNRFDAKEPLIAEQSAFIRKKEDIITLRTGRESAGFDGLVERGLTTLDQRIFVTEELREKTDDIRIHYYAPSRIDKLVNLLITAVIFVLLALPVVVLYRVTEGPQRNSPFEAVGILIIFTLLFGCAMSTLTKATRQELFAASAAYCAVLVVFIINFSTQ